jgi:signal transduction histidine kinase
MQGETGRTAGLVAAVVVATACAVVAAAAEVAVQRGDGAALGVALAPVALAVVAVSFCVMGAWIAHARPAHVLGWLFLLVGTLTQAGVMGSNAARAGWLAWDGTALGLAVDFLAGLGLLLLLGLLPLVYPAGRLRGRAAVGIGILIALAAALVQVQWLWSQLDPNTLWPFADAPTRPAVWVDWVPLGLLAAGVATGWVLCLIRLVRAGHPERQQLAWLLVTVVAVFVTQSLGDSPVAMTLQAAALWLLPVAIAVGILRYGLLGINTVLPRAVTGSVLALAITMVYLVAAAVGELAGSGMVGPGLAASLVVAVVVVPLRDRLRAGVDRFLYGQQAVREQLRRDLHDGLGSSLTGMRLGLVALGDALAEGATERAKEITTVLAEETDRSVAEVRRILDGLRPAELADVDLATALRRRAATGAPTPVSVDVGRLPPLPSAMEDGIFKVVTEALANAHKHSGACMINVHVSAGPAGLIARIADDGQGISGSAQPGVGLASMRARAAELGGRLDLATSETGTCVTLTVPLPQGGLG